MSESSADRARTRPRRILIRQPDGHAIGVRPSLARTNPAHIQIEELESRSSGHRRVTQSGSPTTYRLFRTNSSDLDGVLELGRDLLGEGHDEVPVECGPSVNRSSNRPSPWLLDIGMRADEPSAASRPMTRTVRSHSSSSRRSIQSKDLVVKLDVGHAFK